jgi:hypothetical protein
LRELWILSLTQNGTNYKFIKNKSGTGQMEKTGKKIPGFLAQLKTEHNADLNQKWLGRVWSN